MLKVALIGIGGMGGCHFNCYKNIENAEITAVCDVREDMAKEKVGDDKIRIYTDYDELLKKEDVDVIDICTPSYMHREMSIKALEKGCHVLCEKPMSLSSADCEAILAAQKKAGKKFMTAHVIRFSTPFMYLKKVIDSKELGNLLRLDMKRLSSIPLWSWEDWMRDTKKSGGTPIDLSIHDIDFIQYVLGEPKKVSCVYSKLKNNNDYVTTDFVYDGCIASAEASWYNYDFPFKVRYLAFFQNGMLEYDGNKVLKNGEEVTLDFGAVSGDMGINVSNVDGYGGEIEYFLSCVENDTEPEIVTPESSLATIKLLERIVENSIVL